MKAILRTHGTTFTVSLFLVTAISGTFLFFHVASGTFHTMHEWLAMALLLPVAFHVWKNWGGLKQYFRRKTIYLPLVATLVAGAAFVVPTLTGPASGGNPMRVATRAIANGTVAQVAPLFNLTPDALSQRLAAKGYKVTSADQPLAAIARASGKEAGPELMAAIANPK